MTPWYLRDASGWARDRTRYGARHRWQRRMALKHLQPKQLCPRCNERLIPESFRDSNGDYRIPRGWLKTLHLDHRDGTNTGYNGLAHAACNLLAAQHTRKNNKKAK